MLRGGALDGRFEKRARSGPIAHAAETDTGLPIARMVKGSLVFDADSLAGTAAGAGATNRNFVPIPVPTFRMAPPSGPCGIKSRSAL
jgi:hypothetical protein